MPYPEYVSIANWSELQHYKDRRPPWIKLHTSLLIDYGYTTMSLQSRAHYIGMMLLASNTDNKIPASARYLRNALHSDVDVNLKEIMDKGLVVPWGTERGKAERAPVSTWKTRYIPQPMRDLVKSQDGGCLECRKKRRLEVDHVVPVSMPDLIDEFLQGDPACAANLQILCVGCNRIKRGEMSGGSVSLQTIARWCLSPRAESLRSNLLRSPVQLRSLETETETETERKRETEAEKNGKPMSPQQEAVAAVWAIYDQFTAERPAAGVALNWWKQLKKNTRHLEECLTSIGPKGYLGKGDAYVFSVVKGWSQGKKGPPTPTLRPPTVDELRARDRVREEEL